MTLFWKILTRPKTQALLQFKQKCDIIYLWLSQKGGGEILLREDAPIKPKKDNYTEERSEQARREHEAIIAERQAEIEKGDFSEESERRYFDRMTAVTQRMVDDFVAHSKENQTFKSAKEALMYLGNIW